MRLSLVSLLSSAQAVLPIISYGNRLYQVNEDATQPGTEFFMVGIDYQPGGSSEFQLNSDSDLLSDPATCMRDALVFQQLGINTIRIYSLSPWLNHDECMTILNNAGIYVLLDLNNPYIALHRENTGDSYNEALLNNVFGLIDAFKYYPNTLGFFSGNEIVNDAGSAESAPKYIRALQRDIKQYIAKHANRTIPVGYSAADDLDYRVAMWQYLQCGDDDESRSDFYGINSYQWCSGSSDWDSSGYQALNDTFANSSIPLFFSEYGCNKNSPRTFDEVTDGVYAEDGLLYTLMGGLIYEYSNEDNNYGLVEIESDGSIKYLDDFNNLKDRYASISLPTITQPSSTNAAPSCDSSLISSLGVSFDWDTDLPDCPAPSLIESGGGNQNIGSLVDISTLTASYKVYDTDGNEVTSSLDFKAEYQTNWQYNVQSSTTESDSSSSSESSTAAATSAGGSSTPASTTASSSSSKDAAVGRITVGGLASLPLLLVFNLI